jgi:hypothetical protein
MNKFHYYLMSGLVRYDYKGETFTVGLNTLLQNENINIIMKDVGQTQQAMQVRFFREVMAPNPDVIIKDVFIQAISYLGHMTQEEFNMQPEPMPSDTKSEDKPAQEVVEASSVILGTSAQTNSPEPLEDVLREENERAVARNEVEPFIVPAEPSNEADKG